MRAVSALTHPGRSPANLARVLAERLLCFFLPLSTLGFYLSGPHRWHAALLWTLPVWLCVAADVCSPSTQRNPPEEHPDWPFDVTLYILANLQIANIVLMLDFVGGLGWSTVSEVGASVANLFAVRILTGTTSCCSAIAVAHEFIHRRKRHQRWMGRLLLWTVCYDHFAVEHIQGHHRHVGTPEDHATARFDETYGEFWRRTVKGQFVNAWRLENRRLATLSKLTRLSRHRVLHGLVIQGSLVAAIFVHFGALSGLMFLYEAFYALRLLESVNYFQHWGLSRTGRRFSGPDAWVTDSWFTLHAFVGLSRHADHHRCGNKPYHRLRYNGEGPRLPYGYFAMYILAKFFNDHYRDLARRELESRGLGPFRKKNARGTESSRATDPWQRPDVKP
jgi:alkane 1-monooxygenase